MTKTTRGIYFLPNCLTTISLFAGFYAIIAAMKGLFDQASIAIYFALITDSLDGRVARLTGTQSNFGAEYDSLSDMVSFGLAPPVTAYHLALQDFGKIGWLIAFCYTVATALRLARFNIEHHDRRYFHGLPCPAAAGLVMGAIWFLSSKLFLIHHFDFILAIFMLITAGLMVSNVRYLSFKDLDFKGKVPFFMIYVVVLLVVAIAWNPPLVLFSGFLFYACSGLCLVAYCRLKKIKK